MDKSSGSQKSFIHPSRAHLFRKPPIPDATFKHPSIKHVGQTWNNRRDKPKDHQTDDQLLVFGYASKIFPPNEHSASIAKNKHMIAWNEDYKLNLLIDRYDCRASLHSLSDFDADLWNKNYQLSDEETKLEAHLDEERYRALFVEELEEDIRHEEELKRLHASIAKDESPSVGAEVGYNYEEDSKEQYDPTEPTNDEEGIQKLFSAPVALAVPKDIEIPPTEKMHAIIEKTALFVSKQGAQMEIVLKAKQSNNNQFLFLQFDHYLNPYYKYMVKRIKEGKYTPGVQPDKPEQEEEEESSDDSDGDGGYLHPSLFASAHKNNKPENDEKTKAIRTIDPDHPLAKLIEKGRQANAIKQYQRMAEAVYNYYQQQGTPGPQTTAGSLEPPPLPSFMTMSGLNAAAKPSISDTASTDLAADSQQQSTNASLDEITWRKDLPLVPPPPDLQEVVEEIAKKVAVEGKETEKALICQADVDYSFLNPWHELHPYYQFRKMSWLRILHPPPPPDPNAKTGEAANSEDAEDEENADKNGSKSAPPISFSIKPREGMKKPLTLPSSNAVLGEAESDDESERTEPKKVEPKKTRSARRRFTDHPPEPNQASPEQPSDVVAVQPTGDVSPEPIKSKPSSSVSRISPPPPVVVVKPSAPPRVPTQSVSSFTAVTVTGEAASISDLREKQAARRRKALLFLKAKTNAENSESTNEPEASKSPDAKDEQSKLAAIASEDIFDLSAPTEEQSNSPDKSSNDEAEDIEEVSQKPLVSNVEIIHQSPPSSRSSTPHSSSSGTPTNRSQSRSPSLSSHRHLRSRDTTSIRMSAKTISELERSSRHARVPSSSSGDDCGEVPSAYRVENIRKKLSTRSAVAQKRSRRRSGERSNRRHKRSRSERSPGSRSRKSKRLSKHSSREKKAKKKRKKSKKTKKTKKRSHSSSSSSTSEKEIEEKGSGLFFDDQDFAMQEQDTNEEIMAQEKGSGSERGDNDVIIEEHSEGEIISD